MVPAKITCLGWEPTREKANWAAKRRQEANFAWGPTSAREAANLTLGRGVVVELISTVLDLDKMMGENPKLGFLLSGMIFSGLTFLPEDCKEPLVIGCQHFFSSLGDLQNCFGTLLLKIITCWVCGRFEGCGILG